MKKDRHEKLKISNNLLDAMLVILTKHYSNAYLTRQMDFHLDNTHEGRDSGNSRNGYGKKRSD